MNDAAPVLDLSILPPYRRPKASEAYWREVAAERIREVYPQKLQLYKWHRAKVETARALHRERAEFAFITANYVHDVMYRGR